MTAPLADPTTALHDLAGRSAVLDDVMKFVAQDLLYAALLVFVVLWFQPDGLRAGLAAGLGALLALGISTLIGDIHYSARPFVADHFTPLFAHTDDASFPSDHLCALGAVAAGAAMSSRLVGNAAALLAGMVAFARVYAGIHYVGDVVAGFVIGAGCAVLIWYALRPAMPLLDRLDAELQRRRLRPRSVGPPVP